MNTNSFTQDTKRNDKRAKSATFLFSVGYLDYYTEDQGDEDLAYDYSHFVVNSVTGDVTDIDFHRHSRMSLIDLCRLIVMDFPESDFVPWRNDTIRTAFDQFLIEVAKRSETL